MGEALAGRRRWIWVAAAVVVLALIGYGAVHALSADATEKPRAAATVAVDRGAVTTEVATTGTVQPAQTRSLSFAVKGTVESVSVRAGSTVGAGQTLAKVDDTEAAEAVSDAQDALDTAEAALTKARESAAKTSATTNACGVNVAAAYVSGSPTGTASPRVTSSPGATAPPSPSKTTTGTAAPTAPATTGGGNTGGGSTTGGQNGGGTSGGATNGDGNTGGGSTGSGTKDGGNTGTGNTTGGGNMNGNTGGGRSGSSAACGSADQQNTRGSGQPGGDDPILSAQQRVTQATTTLAEAEEALEGATITAPIAGRIISVAGKVGSQVGAGATFITLADVYDMQISAAFPEADADRLAVRQAGVVTLADRPGTEFKATVVQVDPTGTSDGTMVRYGVLLSFVDAPKDLLVGQSAGVRVTTGAKSGVLRVPSTAVHDVHGDAGTVLKAGAPVQVGVGLRGDQYTEITSGLAEGDQVTRSW